MVKTKSVFNANYSDFPQLSRILYVNVSHNIATYLLPRVWWQHQAPHLNDVHLTLPFQVVLEYAMTNHDPEYSPSHLHSSGPLDLPSRLVSCGCSTTYYVVPAPIRPLAIRHDLVPAHAKDCQHYLYTAITRVAEAPLSSHFTPLSQPEWNAVATHRARKAR